VVTLTFEIIGHFIYIVVDGHLSTTCCMPVVFAFCFINMFVKRQLSLL